MSSNRSESAASRARPSVRWLERRLTRRSAIKYVAVGTGVIVGSLYVKPGLRSIGITPAYAQATPIGGDGCTPGFWKNHPRDWPCPFGESPCSNTDPAFDSEFDVGLHAGTLGGSSKKFSVILGTGGGCEIALARHAVSALLNFFALGGGFALTEAQIKDIVKVALASTDCDFIGTSKAMLESANETSCPLGGKMPPP